MPTQSSSLSPQSSVPSHERVDILGVKVSAINMEMALETVESWIANREPRYVTVTPLHAIIDANEQPELMPMFNGSGMTTPDGMSIVWLLKWKGYRHVDRVYGPDLMLAVCDRSQERGWKHFLYGGAEGVAADLESALVKRFPKLQVVGRYTPPFRPLTPEEDAEVKRQIDASGADIVWVGISTPKQERWMVEHCGKVSAPVMFGVGAAFDFLSGRKSQAPRWIQRSGLEWLYRLATEPRRLWRRYAKYLTAVPRLIFNR
jgi:N-acetylglucosaminyldiphosphoundecaprenol N-acetyl-beta-D-mannosaminyltransferase